MIQHGINSSPEQWRTKEAFLHRPVSILLFGGLFLFAFFWVLLVATPADATYTPVPPPATSEDDSRIASVVATPASTVPGAVTTYTLAIQLTETLEMDDGTMGVYFTLPSGCPPNQGGGQYCQYMMSQDTTVLGLPVGVDASVQGDNISIRPEEADLLAGTLNLTVIGVKNPESGGLGKIGVDTRTSEDPEQPPCEPNQPCPPSDRTYSDPVYMGDIAFKGTVTYDGGDYDGQGMEQGWVNFNNESFWSGGNTDNDGNYVIMGPVSAGTYFARAEVPNGVVGYLPQQKQVNYTSGTMTVDFALEVAQKTLTGEIQDEAGNPVDDASIWLNSQSQQNGYGTDVDEDGHYEIKLACGEYNMGLNASWNQETQQQNVVDWIDPQQSKGQRIVSFACDDETETQTLNITVKRVTSSVSGRVLKPDNTPMTRGHIDLRNDKGQGGGGGLGQDGRFTIPVDAGSYRINVWVDDARYYYSSTDPVKVGEDADVNLGNLVLGEKTSVVKGTVTDSDGNPVQNVRINGWVRSGSGWAEARTGADGKYSMYVFPGDWQIQADLWEVNQNSDVNYINTERYELTIGEDQTVTGQDFELTVADATIVASIVGDVNTGEFFGWAHCFDPRSMEKGSDFGGQLNRGRAEIPIIGGNDYICGIGLPPESDYGISEEVEVSIDAGETKNIEFELKEKDASVRVILKDQDGAKVQNVNGEVFCFSAEGPGGWNNGMIGSNGEGTVRLIGGKKYMCGYHLWEDSGYLNTNPKNEPFMVEEGDALTKIYTAYKSNATVRGTVTDPDGEPMGQGWVGASNRKFVENGAIIDGVEGSQIIDTGTEVRHDGTFELPIIAGQYEMFTGNGKKGGSSDMMPPEIEVFTITKNETQVIDLQYREADAHVSGTAVIEYDDGSTDVPQWGFCWAWSEDQGFSGSEMFEGEFSIPLNAGTWNIGCDSHDQGTNKFYRSEEKQITVQKDDELTEHFTLQEGMFNVPEGLTKSFDCTSQQEIRLPDGTQVTIPANALCTSGQATLIAEPQTQMYFTKDSKPLMFAWNFEAMTASSGEEGEGLMGEGGESGGGSQLVETFNSPVTLQIPYSQEVVDSQGINEEDIIMKFWDEQSGTWKQPDNVTIDTLANIVTASVSHFTDFAVVNSGGVSGGAATSHDLVVTPWSKGGPQVAVWNKDGDLLATWFAYSQDLRMGITTYSGDLDGNGVNEIITIPGEGFSSQVRVFDARDGRILSQFFAYDERFKGGINLAVFDLDGDGESEIITVPQKNATSDVKIFDRNGALLGQFNAYGGSFTKGALVNAADLDGNGTGEIVLAPVDGSGQVRVFNNSGDPLAQFNAYGDGYNKGIASIELANLDGQDSETEILTTPREGGSQVRIFNRNGGVVTQFNAYGSGFTGGSRVSVGDVHGDGVLDIIALPNSNGSAQARVFTKDGDVLSQFFAYPPETTRPGRFSATVADLDGNGVDEIVFGTGVDLGPNVRVFDRDGNTLSQFMALHSGFRGGINVNAIAR